MLSMIWPTQNNNGLLMQADTETATMTLKILTIDDSPTIRAMLDSTLTEAGFEVYQAENGRDGLGMLGVIRPDIVITDINMSVMGGFTFIREIRQEKRHAGLPILVMTTEGSDEFKQRGRELGATGWITKPFDPDKLVRIINRVAQSEMAAPAA